MFDFRSTSNEVQFGNLKSGDTIWVGRFPGERRVRIQIEGKWGHDAFDCTVLAARGGIAKLYQDPLNGSLYFGGPNGERGKPVYIAEKEDRL